ncbi:hypothetical protein DPMN_073296 [Dreissena polymorpha]|uniref:Uncharacterized protein n=1 Tax=Dreissena polymorpha TaxID=45954 RepID=A0A9D4HAS9_DREPO|nr:hypothetical protein DPMN_073296 [Dreissena polymorpha]
MLTGHKDSMRTIYITNIYNAIGEQKVKALPAMHTLTGSDTIDQIHGVGKKTALKCILACSDEALDVIARLGEGDLPSLDVVNECMKYLCSYSSPNLSLGEIRWTSFLGLSSVTGIDKIPPTYGT